MAVGAGGKGFSSRLDMAAMRERDRVVRKRRVEGWRPATGGLGEKIGAEAIGLLPMTQVEEGAVELS